MMNYVLRRQGSGDGLVDIPLYTTTGLFYKTSGEDHLPSADYIFRWGCTATVGEGQVVNSAKAIHRVYDKRAFRMELSDNMMSPRSWSTLGNWLACHEGEHDNGFPVLIRKNNHSRSEDMYVCRSFAEAADVCERLGSGNYYISELIQKTHEYRVMFVSGRVIAIIEKRPRDRSEVSWGCVDTGNYDYIQWDDWPLDVAKLGLDAAKLSGLDFGAIDIISDQNRSYVLEINSAPWLSPYFCKIFTEAFDYIVKNGKEQIPYVDTTNFHGYIHPSRYANARIA